MRCHEPPHATYQSQRHAALHAAIHLRCPWQHAHYAASIGYGVGFERPAGENGEGNRHDLLPLQPQWPAGTQGDRKERQHPRGEDIP